LERLSVSIRSYQVVRFDTPNDAVVVTSASDTGKRFQRNAVTRILAVVECEPVEPFPS
jgi:hypothetical protein